MWDPAHVTLRVKLYMHTKIEVCSSKNLSGQFTIFGFFGTARGVGI